MSLIKSRFDYIDCFPALPCYGNGNEDKKLQRELLKKIEKMKA